MKKYSFSKPRLESEKLISSILKLDRITLYAYFDMELSLEQKEKIKEYLKRMARDRKSFDELKELEEDKKEIENFEKENRELLEKSIVYLEKNGIKESKLDSEYIFSHILGVKRSMLFMNLRKKIEDSEKEKIKELLIKRAKERKPIQYLLGEWEFFGYPFKVDERVLIPRADTEILVEQCKFILEEIGNGKVLDIGTGSGAIVVSLAKQLKDYKFFGVDISEEALQVAKENVELNGVQDKIKLLKSDIFSNVEEREFDMIISNPPYIPKNEYEELMPEVRLHEPKGALTDNGDGFYFYEKIVKDGKEYLKNGGYMVFEVGYNQADEVVRLFEQNLYDVVGVVKDYGGIDRVVIGRKRVE